MSSHRRIEVRFGRGLCRNRRLSAGSLAIVVKDKIWDQVQEVSSSRLKSGHLSITAKRFQTPWAGAGLDKKEIPCLARYTDGIVTIGKLLPSHSRTNRQFPGTMGSWRNDHGHTLGWLS